MRSSSCNWWLGTEYPAPGCACSIQLFWMLLWLFQSLWQVNWGFKTYSYGSKLIAILRTPSSASCCQILSSLINDSQQIIRVVLWLAAVRSFWIYRVRPQNQWGSNQWLWTCTGQSAPFEKQHFRLTHKKLCWNEREKSSKFSHTCSTKSGILSNVNLIFCARFYCIEYQKKKKKKA